MTTFNVPLKVVGDNGITGDPTTDTQAYVHTSKVVYLGPGSESRKIITIPPKSTLTNLRATATSAFATDVSAANVSWGNSAQATRYGVISVSALGLMRGATVSAGTDFDTGGTLVITLSAVSTTTFTAGGARAFIEYITTE